MGRRNAERERHVKVLRRLAGQNNLPAPPTNGSRPRVEAVAQQLAALSLGPEDREALDSALRDFKATFEVAEEDAGAEEAAEAEEPGASRVWKFRAVQLTYNSRSWRPDMEGLEALWDEFQVFIQGLANKLESQGLSTTMESAGPANLHLHAYMHLAQSFHRRGANALVDFVFRGIHPHLATNKASGNAYAGAVRYGHFYVVVDKKGSMKSWSNHRPFEAYAVEGWWLDNLLKAGKLTRGTYLAGAAKVTVGFAKRLQDCKAAERFEQDAALEEAVARDASALVGVRRPMKAFEVVEEFISLHDGSPRFRRPVLAIVGGTRLGKSMLASDILERIAKRLDLPGFLEITVEESQALDLADFNREIHAGVLLDGLADTFFLKRHRESLQGRAKIVKGGQSATNVYAYRYSLCGRAVVTTLDLSAAHLEAFQQDHWLCHRENVMFLRLEGPAYQESDQVPASPPQQRKRLRRWVGSTPSPARQLIF